MLIPRPRRKVTKVINRFEAVSTVSGLCQGPLGSFIHVFVLVQNEGHVMHAGCGINETFPFLFRKRILKTA